MVAFDTYWNNGLNLKKHTLNYSSACQCQCCSGLTRSHTVEFSIRSWRKRCCGRTSLLVSRKMQRMSVFRGIGRLIGVVFWHYRWHITNMGAEYTERFWLLVPVTKPVLSSAARTPHWMGAGQHFTLMFRSNSSMWSLTLSSFAWKSFPKGYVWTSQPVATLPPASLGEYCPLSPILNHQMIIQILI